MNITHQETRGRTHGKKLSPEYQAWRSMIHRCTYPGDRCYSIYGGRGITVHKQWLKDFPAFLAHVGRRPSPRHSLDRIDNNGNYEPGNVRWANPREQQRNKRTAHLITAFGECRTITEWAEFIGVHRRTIQRRMLNGQSAEKAIGRNPNAV